MKISVGVLFGGRSVENEISVVTAIQVIESLDKEKYDVVPIYIAKSGKWYSGAALLDLSRYRDMPSLLKSCREVYFKSIYGDHNLYSDSLFGKAKSLVQLDCILPTLHGTNCEDGTLQGVLEVIGIPYVGCNTFASANGMDKIAMKQILRDSGISVVDFCWFSDKEWDESHKAVIEKVEKQLSYPVIVKPANSGSSVGISPAHNSQELEDAIDNAAQFTTRIIVERMLSKLKEVNCSVMGDYYDCEPSVCEVPLRSGEILSYSDKYQSGGSKGGKLGAKAAVGAKGAAGSKGMSSLKRELPAKISEDTTSLVKDYAVRTFKTLACEGLARVDLMIDEEDGRVYVNEINTIPGSLSSYLWDYTGIPFPEVLDRLISRAFDRSREESFKVTDFGGNIFANNR
ncbi:MAG: D-alanine--D-alanine ligase family protein [Candidatus Cryptobacteroides sp.]